MKSRKRMGFALLTALVVGVAALAGTVYAATKSSAKLVIWTDSYRKAAFNKIGAQYQRRIRASRSRSSRRRSVSAAPARSAAISARRTRQTLPTSSAPRATGSGSSRPTVSSCRCT